MPTTHFMNTGQPNAGYCSASQQRFRNVTNEVSCLMLKWPSRHYRILVTGLFNIGQPISKNFSQYLAHFDEKSIGKLGSNCTKISRYCGSDRIKCTQPYPLSICRDTVPLLESISSTLQKDWVMMKEVEIGKFQVGAACNAIKVSLLSRDSAQKAHSWRKPRGF